MIVVTDPDEPEPEAVRAAAQNRSFTGLVVERHAEGVSAARNAGWRQARGELILFMGDDILAAPELVAEHLRWHRNRPEPAVGVLGLVRWADALKVTPFMRWLEGGIQFDYEGIRGSDAGWGRLYASNVSLKRSMLERVGGFDESLLFGYEDVDLGYRMHREGLELLFNPAAEAEHLHPTGIEEWRGRMAKVAVAERQFVRKHPELRPHFYELFDEARSWPEPRGRLARAANLIPDTVPLLGPRIRLSCNAVFLKALAPAFLEAWERAGERD